MSKPDVTVEPIFDKKEATHKMFSEVEKRRGYGEWDKPFSALNQLFSGHSILNSHQAKVDKNISYICEACQDRAGGCRPLSCSNVENTVQRDNLE